MIKVKYKQLPSEKTINKLLATAFESPAANREVYNWCQEVLKHIRFLESERIKLVQKYGKDDGNGNFSVFQDKRAEFFSKFAKILEMDIDEEIKSCPVKQSWFDDERCSFSKNKELWFTPQEIGQFEK